MSKPLYICLESADIISPLKFDAICTAKFVFPVAVGPKITISSLFLFKFISICVFILIIYTRKYIFHT